MFLDKLHEVPLPPAQAVPRRQPRKTRPWAWTALTVLAVAALGWGWWWYSRPVDQSSHVAVADSAAATAETSQPGRTVLGSRSPKDADEDGLADELEALYGTKPTEDDSDSDGFSDGEEVSNGYEPRNDGAGVRMVDLGLVSTLNAQVEDVSVISSGLSTATAERFYLAFDGISTVYYDAAGSVVAQCVPGVEPTGTCATLPNELRTDFSRVLTDGTYTDSYHIPF
ncbi:MAG: hypothetical protein HY567_04675 [Candidatus Kerfeldbacteria bacterium]|nr:hypothetical protein [Candidatus Kerfeldbacteria bacterium]